MTVNLKAWLIISNHLEAIRCMNDQYTHVLAYFRYTEVKWDEKLTEIQTLRRNTCIVQPFSFPMFLCNPPVFFSISLVS